MTERPKTMCAVLLTGHGDFDKLEYHQDVPVPAPGPDEVLVHVSASSVNNTDINTRIGWYAKGDSEATDTGETAIEGAWTGEPIKFPLIQGIDAAGTIVEAGQNVDARRIGQRVIVQSCLNSLQQDEISPFLGSERNGGFAEYVVVPAADAHKITSEITDIELGAVPCAYGTAENMLTEANLKAGEQVLITGATGNVGLAAVQLAKLRGAQVHVVASPAKQQALMSLGVASCSDRDLAELKAKKASFDVVIDLVGGEHFGTLLDLMKPFGRLAISGAVGGAMANIDLRTVYLKNLKIIGCTEQSRESFVRLVGLINQGRLKPPVHTVYPLADLVSAQKEFMDRKHIGKIVIRIS